MGCEKSTVRSSNINSCSYYSPPPPLLSLRPLALTIQVLETCPKTCGQCAGVAATCTDNDRLLQTLVEQPTAKCSYYQFYCDQPDAIKVCPFTCGVCADSPANKCRDNNEALAYQVGTAPLSPPPTALFLPSSTFPLTISPPLPCFQSGPDFKQHLAQ
jgi:hypothetical protein